jgi:Restriction endonuclease
MYKKLPEWKRFEQAVAAFAAALDPSATVKHDLRLPDRHHGRRRQRDVWIDAKIGGHFPVSVLVSCKRTKRKLNSADVDSFSGELASSPARVGVLYSYSGFTQGAIDKGRVLGISCCRLYSGKGPEIPHQVWPTSCRSAASGESATGSWPHPVERSDNMGAARRLQRLLGATIVRGVKGPSTSERWRQQRAERR